MPRPVCGYKEGSLSDTAVEVSLDVDFFRRWITRFAEAVDGSCDELTRLDAAIGDADHGVNMQRGLRAVVASLATESELESPQSVLSLVGNRLMSVVGGAAGPLYGTAFRAMAQGLGNDPTVEPEDLVKALRAGLDGIQRIGAAEPGDKTIVDAWYPAAMTLETSGRSVRSIALEAERASREGMLATIPLRARKGRASYLGWRSEGHQDPGATSAHLIFVSLVSATR